MSDPTYTVPRMAISTAFPPTTGLLRGQDLAIGRRFEFCDGPSVFSDLFHSGLQLGSIASIDGPGSRSLGVSLLSAVQGSDWGCIVGLDNHGITSYSEKGLNLSRTLFVNDQQLNKGGNSTSAFTRVLAECVASVKVVLAEVPRHLKITGTEIARIKRHLSKAASVLILLGGRISDGLDYSLATSNQQFSGIGEGFGRIRQRMLDIDLTVRRNPGLNASLSAVVV